MPMTSGWQTFVGGNIPGGGAEHRAETYNASARCYRA